MRKIKRKFRCCILLAIMLSFVVGIQGNDVLASEIDSGLKIKFRQAVTDENKIKAYVRGEGTADGASYQIGNIPVSSLETYGIVEDRNPARTLVMLDNSRSMPESSHEQIKELLNSVLNAHMEKEVFRLATFSDKIDYMSDTYTSDYTALKNMVNSIDYYDQETYLTDVLYDVIDDLNKDAYMGYTRLIIISDGVDNKPLGVTREELNLKLRDTPYPIYTVGVFTGNNNDQLENMFALSRITGSEYCVFGENAVNEIVSAFSKDSSITVFEALIPEEAKVGGKQGSKLILTDGSQVVFDVNLPFYVQKGTQPEPEAALPTAEPETEPSKEKAGWQPGILIIGGIAVVITAAIILAILLMRKREKAKGIYPLAEEDVNAEIQGDTFIIGEELKLGVLPSAGETGKKMRYKVTLTDKNDISCSFQCELRNSISIGRSAGNDIVLNATNISKKHCMITNKNGRLFIQDLNSTNGTAVNGERIHFDTEIFSGSIIQIGKSELLVKFEQV